MANKKQEVHVRDDKTQLSFVHHSTDTPLLPSTEYLQQLQQINPEAVNWILSETSKEAQSRRDLDAKKLSTISRGQSFGFIFGMACLISTCVLAYLGAYTSSAVVGGSTLVTVVLAFLANKKTK